MNTVTIKVERNYRVSFAAYTAILSTLLVEISGCIVLPIQHNLKGFVIAQFVLLGIIGVCALGYGLAEIVNRKRLVVTEEEIIRYKGNNIIYKINKIDVIQMLYKKPGFLTRLLFLVAVSINLPFVGILSIRYKNADIDGPKAHHSYEELDTLEDEEKASGMKERLELLSAREVKKICAVLGKEVSYI